MIERLRTFVVERGKIARGSDIVTACNNSALSLSDLRALLAALEAAREDAAEAKQNGYELGLLAGAQEAERLRGVIARYERKLDAAIDQARGKGGGEVEGG